MTDPLAVSTCDNGAAGTSSAITNTSTMPTAVGVLVPPRRPFAWKGLASMARTYRSQTRTCEICRSLYTTRVDRRTSSCSRACGAVLRWGDPEARFWAKVETTETCWPWMASRGPRGYGLVRVRSGTTRAHRAAWAFARGPIPDGLCVLHHCDNPPCVRVTPLRVDGTPDPDDHLFLGDRRANADDAIAKGRMAFQALGWEPYRGAEHPLARLTPGQVREIRVSGAVEFHRIVAARFGISRQHVDDII